VFLLYALKGTGAAAFVAASELLVSGQAIAVAAAPMLLTMWYATRLYARRRTLAGDRA